MSNYGLLFIGLGIAVVGLWNLARWEPNRIPQQKQQRLIIYPVWVERWRARRAERKLQAMIRQAEEVIGTEEERWRANQTVYFRYPDL